MFIQKTHFEQVPLEMVKKMIAEQSQREEITQKGLATSSDAVKAIPQGEQDKSVAKSSALSPRYVWTLW
jgi:hypothetical protein